MSCSLASSTAERGRFGRYETPSRSTGIRRSARFPRSRVWLRFETRKNTYGDGHPETSRLHARRSGTTRPYYGLSSCVRERVRRRPYPPPATWHTRCVRRRRRRVIDETRRPGRPPADTLIIDGRTR